MPIAPSFQDFLDQGQAEASVRRPDLAFFDGDITIAFLHAGAAMADAVTRFIVQALKATYLDTAAGDELTTLANDHWDIQRQPATSAQVTQSFSRPSAGGGEPAGSIPAGTTIATDFSTEGEAVSFVTDAAIAWGVGELGPKTVAATAVETGRESNVKAATLVRVLDIPGFDSTFTTTNAAAAAGGNPEEADEELRQRVRNKSATLRRGTLAALVTGALEVLEVRSAISAEDPVTADVSVTVTDLDGNSTAQMVQDVITELESWRCAGIPIEVLGGTQLAVSMGISLVVRVGYDVAAASTDLVAAVENRMQKLRGNDTLYLDTLIGAIIAVAPDDILDVIFDSITFNAASQPIADIVPATGQIIRADVITVVAA